MTFDPAKTLTRFHDAINALDFPAIEAAFARDAVYGSIKVGALAGRKQIMAAFRAYFETYPDQVAVDELVETVSPTAARSVWRVKATDSRTGLPMVRHGEETLYFDAAGLITRVDVTDYHK